MKPRDFLFTSTGRVRAGWRALLFCIVALALYQLAFLVIFAIGRPASSALFQLEAYLVLLLVFWLAHLIMLRWVDRAPWSYVGLGRENFTPRVLSVGFALGALCILVPSGTLLVAHDLSIDSGLHGSHSWFGLAVAGAAIFLPQSLGEEMLARGYLFSSLREAIGWLGALAVTSLGFGLLHWRNPGANVQSVSVVVFAGIFLGAILIATRSLYAAWMAHFA
ncbi:MAG: lysostaphin resistance A-like protein, partial [Gemmatimonadaceae bacterium]